MGKYILVACFLFVILILFSIFSYYLIFSNNEFYDTRTRALCNGNVCQDYELTCLKGKVISSRAISGFVVFGDDWVDRRNEKDNGC